MLPVLLRNPQTGESIRVLESTPERFRFEFSLGPRAAIPGTHTHPHTEQRVVVTSGTMHLRVAGRHRVVQSGEAITVAAGTPHLQWNPSDEELRAIEEYTPGGRIHEMFETFFRLAGGGMLNARGGVRSPLLLAAFFAEFRDEVRASPRLFQWGFDLLAPVARAFGRDKALRLRGDGDSRT